MTNDKSNPYRFTGEVEPYAPLPHPAPILPLTLDEMRRIALCRRLLLVATIVHYAGWFLMILASDPLPWIDDDYVFAIGATCLFPLVIFGAVAMPRLSPRFAIFKAFWLLVPLLNVVVVAYVLRDSRRRLEDQGVRLGWFVDASSPATSDPADDEARSE